MSQEEFKKLKELLKPIFRGYKRVNSSMMQKLNALGFNVVRSKNHIIMNYWIGDNELRFEIDKTPGDKRSGIKTVKDIGHVFMNSGLIY